MSVTARTFFAFLFLVLMNLPIISYGQEGMPVGIVDSGLVVVADSGSLLIYSTLALVDSPAVVIEEDTLVISPEMERQENFHIVRTKPQDHTLLFYFFAFILGIYAYVKVGYSGHYSLLLRTVTNFRLARQYFNEGVLKFSTPTLLLTVNSILVFGVCLYLALRTLNLFEEFTFGQLLIISSIVVATLIWLRYFVKLFLAWLLPERKKIQFYLFNIIIVNLFLSMALFPVAVIMTYVSIIPSIVVLYAGTAIILLFMGYRTYRAWLIGKESFQFYKFHFILYLCTLEILPLLVLAKLCEFAY